MEYIIKVQREDKSIITTRKDIQEIIECARNYVADGYTISECYQKNGITNLKQSLIPPKIQSAVVLPQAESNDAVLLALVKESADAMDITNQLLLKVKNMENQAQTIVCPNCGASATNHHNCEYCGSLLVRFAEKNIAIEEEKYGHEAFRFAGLEEALTRNLEEQARTSGRNHIHTFIKSPTLGLDLDVTNPKSQTELILYSWGDDNTFRIKPTIQPSTDEQCLVICIRFYEITSKMWAMDERYSNGIVPEFNAYNNEAHARFQGMDIYDLFSLQTDTLVDEGSGFKVGKVYQYYLDFGRDVEGAAAIITQYLLGNYEITNPHSLRLSYELSSSTDEEYQEGVKAATRTSKIMFWFIVVLAAIFVLAGIFVLGEDAFIGIVGIALGTGVFWYAKTKMNS